MVCDEWIRIEDDIVSGFDNIYSVDEVLRIRLLGTMMSTMSQIHCSRLVLFLWHDFGHWSESDVRCSNDGQLKTHTVYLATCFHQFYICHVSGCSLSLERLDSSSQNKENSCETLSTALFNERFYDAVSLPSSQSRCYRLWR